MTGIWGVDIHPRYQADINIERIRNEDFDFMAVKVSEGTTSFMAQGSADFLRRGKATGLMCLGYHYLRPGREEAQAAAFTSALISAGVPGMLDAEAFETDGVTPSLTVDGIRGFLRCCASAGCQVPLLYLPRWYWERMGCPNLDGLPPLWTSRYVGGPSKPASVMYGRHNPAAWEPYGKQKVAVLQFTDRAVVAGRAVDANHYPGTREEFAALIGGDTVTADDVWKFGILNFKGQMVPALAILSATEGRVNALAADIAALKADIEALKASTNPK